MAGLTNLVVGGQSGTTAVATLPSNVAAGSGIFVAVAQGDAASVSVTDSQGNTYSSASAGQAGLFTFLALNCAAGATTITVHLSNSGESCSFVAAEVPNALTTGAIDATASTETVSTSGTDPLTLSSTMAAAAASANSTAIIYARGDSNASSITWDSPSGSFAFGAGQTDQNDFYCAALGSVILSATTALTGTLRQNAGGAGGNNMIGGIVVIKTTGGGGGTTAALTAVASTTGLGTTLGAVTSKAASGNTATGAPGTAKANVSIALSGVSSTTSVGTVSSGPPILVPVTSTLTVGTAKAGFALALTAVQATSAVSSVTAGLAAPLTPVSSASATGAVGKGADKPLTGATAAGTPGTVAVGLGQALSGVSSTTTVNAAGAAVTVALSGVSSTTSVGTVRGPGLLLAPVSAAGAPGTVVPGVAHALSAVSSTSTPGSAKATPTSPLSAVQATGSAGTVRFGNVVVGLSGVIAHGSAGTLAPPAAPDYKNAELFMAIQSGVSGFYLNNLRTVVPNKRGAIMLGTGGTWTVPTGATNVFLSAAAGGGSPFGLAGQQLFHQWLAVKPGDVLTVTFDSLGNITVMKGTVQLLYLYAGPPYKKHAWQSTFGQSSGIQGFGSGVDAGTPFPPILVFYWN